jgi:hypothetical protein
MLVNLHADKKLLKRKKKTTPQPQCDFSAVSKPLAYDSGAGHLNHTFALERLTLSLPKLIL